jgi:p-cymene methyl-monooxygenase electron transfer component
VNFLSSLLGKKVPRIIEVVPLGSQFEVPAGRTILEAALANGIDFPHDCTVGTCGTCKSRLLDGRIDALSEFAYTLSREELAANFILPCQSIPKTGLVRIEVAVPETRVAPSQAFEGRIIEQTPLTHDILHVQIELDKPMRYLAGQYANFTAPDGTRARSYSFADPPSPSGSQRVAFFVRRVPGGALTEALFAGQLAKTTMQIEGPHGAFYLREGSGPIVCIAGGSGLAPILSMLEDAARRSVVRPCALLFGARTAQDLYALERIGTLSTRWAGPFSFLPVLSHEPPGTSWTGARGLVTEFASDAMASGDCKSISAYLCGPPGMIDAAIAGLTARGVPVSSILYDKFTDASHVARLP